VTANVRAKLASHVRAHTSGHFKVNQSDFAVKDFQFAFGAIDRLDFEANRTGRSGPRLVPGPLRMAIPLDSDTTSFPMTRAVPRIACTQPWWN